MVTINYASIYHIHCILNTTGRTMTLIILLYALFASSFPIGKILLGYTKPIFLTGSRMFIAGLILLAYQYFWPTASFRFKKKHWKLYAQIILFGICFNYILRFWALEYMPASKTSFFYNFSPLISSLYSYIIFGEKITKRQWTGLSIGFIGMIPLLMGTSPGEQKFGELFFISLPEIAVLCSVALHSYSWIIVRKLVREKSYSPMMVNGLCMTFGGLLALIISPFFEGIAPVTNVSSFLGWLVLIILISNIICHNLYAHLLKQYTATFLSFAGFLSPIFASLYGWAFLEEKITWNLYVSGAIVLAGLYLFYKDEYEEIPDQIVP